MTNHTTITGNMGREVELRFTPGGKAVASFSVADTPRKRNDDGTWEDSGETLWVDVSVWEAEAEALAERSNGYKGRVTVTGTLGIRTYQAKDGTERKSVTLKADSVALHAVNAPKRHVGGQSFARAPQGGAPDDPWATPAAHPMTSDTPPF